MISLMLCAGYATRMYPLTEQFPKPLLPVGDSTILTRLIQDLDSIEQIERHVVVSNHKFIGQFESWAKQLSIKKPLVVLDDGSTDNATRLGAVRDIQFAIDGLSLDDDLLVTAGDNLLTFSLGALVQESLRQSSSMVMCYEELDQAAFRRSGVLVKDDQGRVLSMVEKPENPPSHFAVPPFYLYLRQDLPLIAQAISDGAATDAPGSLVSYLCSRTRICALPMPGQRIDVGDIQGYERIKAQFNV
ncbi:NTP transferase domain-containing protein [Eubacteriales bacterium OttesenSCG-928-N13]|nr:NTP transferase domain-containing protein [Eubacteriales bacterium OttesenSCG-928-N13]